MLNPKIQMYEIKKKAHSIEYAFFVLDGTKTHFGICAPNPGKRLIKKQSFIPCVSRNGKLKIRSIST
jgi:hypothetical protein